MEEGRSLWQNKKREQLEQEIREQEEVQQLWFKLANDLEKCQVLIDNTVWKHLGNLFGGHSVSWQS